MYNTFSKFKSFSIFKSNLIENNHHIMCTRASISIFKKNQDLQYDPDKFHRAQRTEIVKTRQSPIEKRQKTHNTIQKNA